MEAWCAGKGDKQPVDVKNKIYRQTRFGNIFNVYIIERRLIFAA